MEMKEMTGLRPFRKRQNRKRLVLTTTTKNEWEGVTRHCQHMEHRRRNIFGENGPLWPETGCPQEIWPFSSWACKFRKDWKLRLEGRRSPVYQQRMRKFSESCCRQHFPYTGRPWGWGLFSYWVSFCHIQYISSLSASVMNYPSYIQYTEGQQKDFRPQSYKMHHEVKEGSQKGRERDDTKFLRA